MTAAVARLGQQWFMRLMPLMFPAVAKRTATETANNIARFIGKAGELGIERAEQRIGYVRLWVTHRGWTENTTWCLDIQHSVHFRGRWTKVPDLLNVDRITFDFQPRVPESADPTEISSYLTIKHVRRIKTHTASP